MQGPYGRGNRPHPAREAQQLSALGRRDVRHRCFLRARGLLATGAGALSSYSAPLPPVSSGARPMSLGVVPLIGPLRTVPPVRGDIVENVSIGLSDKRIEHLLTHVEIEPFTRDALRGKHGMNTMLDPASIPRNIGGSEEGEGGFILTV